MSGADYRGRQLAESRRLLSTERVRLRAMDVEESRNLLLELALYEPNITVCFNLLINACLTEDIEIAVKGKSMTDTFRQYVNIHYHTFCADAIKCMFIYGFVPWYPRKLPSGDLVPMVLPHGSFTWGVKCKDKEEAAGRASGPRKTREEGAARVQGKTREEGPGKPPDSGLGKTRSRWEHLRVPETENESKLVQHQVLLTHANVAKEDVFVFDTSNADLHVSGSSNIFATVPSPLSHLLIDYKNLRDAQVRRSYADAWNTTARIFTSCIPPNAVSNEPTHSYLYYETGSDRSRLNQGRHFMTSRHRELENQISQPSNHVPSLYNLPIHHRLEQLHALTPCEDLEWLLEKYRRDVSSLVGIPYEVAFGRAHGGNETRSGVGETTSRSFSNTIYRVCKVLEELVRHVYAALYEADLADVTVSFSPMPRLDISSMEDLKTLFDIGAITPDVTAQLSEILLLGERTNMTGRKRKTTHSDGEYLQNLRKITEATNPPRNEPAKKPPKAAK